MARFLAPKAFVAAAETLSLLPFNLEQKPYFIPLKDVVIEVVRAAGHEVLDLGTNDTVSVDYPDFAEKLGHAITTGQAERGVLVCGSGVGASVAANKINGIYAGLCHDVYSAHQGVEHDDVNVLCLGGRVVGPALAYDILHSWLTARYVGTGRHKRRVDQILEIERSESERRGTLTHRCPI